MLITAFELSHRWQRAARAIMLALSAVSVFGVWFCVTGRLLSSPRKRACIVMLLPVTITTVRLIPRFALHMIRQVVSTACAC